MKMLFSALFRLTLALALSIPVSLPQAAWAFEPSGHKFCENGIGTPDLLASKLEHATDLNAPLPGCKASASLFLQAFKQTKAGSALQNVRELAALLRRLKPMDIKPGTDFEVSCLWQMASGMQVKLRCETRAPRPGEVIYGDPATHELLIMSSCANPGVAEATINVTATCLEIRFPPMRKGAAIRFAYLDDRALPGNCHKYQLAGERTVRTSTPEECPDTYEVPRNGRMIKVVCSWEAVSESASRKLGHPVQVQNVSGSFYARVDAGTNHWFLPPAARGGMAAICWEDTPGHWTTLGITGKDYVEGVATITPEQVRTLHYAGN